MPAVNETGLFVSHLMVCFESDATQRQVSIEKLATIQSDAEVKNIQFIVAETFGHESDALIMVLADSAEELLGIEQAVKRSGVKLVDSFLSICETSEYVTTEAEEQARIDSLDESAEIKEKMMSDWRERMEIYKRHKLYPQLPPKAMSYMCFYPMSKSRGAINNWYALDFERRAELMRNHGAVGRRYSGRIAQLITGSAGLSDWEWGVTLFSKTLEDVKEIVYEMRFDEASALYGQFGPFIVGKIIDIREI